MKTKNLTIFDRAQVTRILAGSDGRVTGVTYHEETARNIFNRRAWCCSRLTPTKTRACLLLSKSKAYPNGLSNNHGQVGRHYFGHWIRAAA